MNMRPLTTQPFVPTAWHHALATLPPALTVESGDVLLPRPLTPMAGTRTATRHGRQATR